MTGCLGQEANLMSTGLSIPMRAVGIWDIPRASLESQYVVWHLEDPGPSHHQVPSSCTVLYDGESEKVSNNLGRINLIEGTRPT